VRDEETTGKLFSIGNVNAHNSDIELRQLISKLLHLQGPGGLERAAGFAPWSVHKEKTVVFCRYWGIKLLNIGVGPFLVNHLSKDCKRHEHEYKQQSPRTRKEHRSRRGCPSRARNKGLVKEIEMIGNVPPVKRTYSRRMVVTDAEEEGHEEERSLEETPSMQSDPDTAVPKYTSRLATAESAKKTKITDFFKKKCTEALEASSSCASSPTAQVAKLIQSQSLSSQPSSPLPSSLKQTYLDLGQKNLFSVQCEQCLMHYNKSFLEDVALHKKFHARWMRGFCLRASDIDRLGLVELNPPQLDRWQEFRVVHIRSFGERTLRALEGFLSFVHTQLGAPTLLPPELDDHSVRISSLHWAAIYIVRLC
jgi:hypothetical protein